jgi:diguanylate cyclase
LKLNNLDLKARSLRVAEIYRRHDISQADVAKFVGASQPQVSRLLAGNITRPLRLFEEICLYAERLEGGVTIPSVGVTGALEQSVLVEEKVQDASDRLAEVNLKLKHEVQERQVLEHKLASAQELEASVLHAAFHDALTGLPNRALFNDRLEHGLAQAHRHGWTLALMFVDLNDFKIINDTYGHAAGDEILRTIAARLTDNTRNDDTVSRHGGDEFLYLLMEVKDESDIAAIAEKIVGSIQQPCTVNNAPLIISASVGISIFPRDGTTADALLKSADKAMYKAKRERLEYVFAS